MSSARRPLLWFVLSFWLTGSTAWALQPPAAMVKAAVPFAGAAASAQSRQGMVLLAGAAQVRAGTAGDSDGDGIDDTIDTDDDNDTVSDDQEGTGDTDDDGVADCLDLDSDNDGIPDLVEAVADRNLLGRLDSDRDGQLDVGVFIGINGLADAVETAPDSGQSITGTNDLDADSLFDQQDLDADNDGLPDVIEAGASDTDFDGLLDRFRDIDGNGLSDQLALLPVATRDTDDDGVFDFRDLDSDQDGLTDLLEWLGQDADGDGRLDQFTDADADGINDDYGPDSPPVADSTGDGVPDHLDDETAGASSAPANQPSSGSETESGSQAGSAPVSAPVSAVEADPVADDGGGSSANPQAAPVTIGQEGGGVGGCRVSAGDERDPTLALLALLASFVLWGRRFTRGVLLVAVVTTAGCAGPGASYSGGAVRDVQAWQSYAGAGFGVSQFVIETEGTGIAVDDDQGTLGMVTAGIRQGPYAIEGRFADLGEVSFVDTDDSLGLQAVDLSSLLSLRGYAVEPFVRLGVGALFGSGGVEADLRNEFHAVLGGGLDVPINERWALRAEMFTHDVDVTLVGLSVLYHFGGGAEVATAPPAVTLPGARVEQPESQRESGSPDSSSTRSPRGAPTGSAADSSEPALVEQRPEPAAEPEPETADPGTSAAETAAPDTSVPETGAPGPSVPGTTRAEPPVAADAATGTEGEGTLPEDESAGQPDADEARADGESGADDTGTTPAPANGDRDADGVIDSQNDCPNAGANTSVDSEGCLLFEGTVVGIMFADLSDQLEPSSDTVLQQVLARLEEDDSRRLTVASHVFDFDDAEANLLLSRRRTLSVIRWLTERGISVSRIRPEAFGSSRPLAEDSPESDSSRLELFLR